MHLIRKSSISRPLWDIQGGSRLVAEGFGPQDKPP
jgi:hypothetical protein